MAKVSTKTKIDQTKKTNPSSFILPKAAEQNA
jgi:hypothetical protein